jgi:hypothetical protein
VTQPGPQPQPPVVPLHTASLTIGVAFFSAWRLEAPRCWFCALACTAMAPSTNAAAVKVIVSFRIKLLRGVKDCEILREVHDNNAATIRHAGRLCSGRVANLHRSPAARRNQQPPPSMQPASMMTRNSAGRGLQRSCRLALNRPRASRSENARAKTPSSGRSEYTCRPGRNDRKPPTRPRPPPLCGTCG